ncbi:MULTISPECIES: ABC transporter substrate-binding protein [Pseudofrankia]|uniref:ABC transporter substrate-binding protein n=1 Tax=Pseudofrankia TaxID=2994363 RepID=UPI000234D328|nr:MULTISPECIES: ABC transporter substrate-binding protein [Pseudofrankia]OHV39093.1 branched-chain amino acid ABC transporter substrate-binding protein [Pseudofrankia sp. EUN1h]
MSLPLRRRALRAAALAASASSLAAGLVACGGSSDNAAAGTCTTTAPGITPTEVKAGMIWSDTGPSASSMRAFRAGVDARLESANDEEGGVFGRKLKYAWRDDRADQALNLSGTQDLINNEHVFGLIAMPSASGSASVDWLSRQKIPVMGLASDPSWLGKTNMFSWFYLGTGSATTWGKYIHDQGGTRAAVFAVASSASNNDFNQQYIASLKASGVQVVRTFQTASAVISYPNVAQQIKAEDIDAIGGVLLPEMAANLLPELRKVGLALGGNLKVALMPLGYDGSSLATYGTSLAGASIFTAVKPFEVNTPGQQKFRQAMNTYSPEIQPSTQDSAVDGWLSADLFIRGLKEAGQCPTRESFITGLRAVKDYDGAGMTPQDANDLSTNYRDISVCYYAIKVSQDGSRFEADSQPECGAPISQEQMNALNQQP